MTEGLDRDQRVMREEQKKNERERTEGLERV